MNTARRLIIRQRIATLNQLLAEMDSPIRVNLSVWSPGDGWTRYMLETEDQGRTLSPALTVAQMEDTLTTLENIFWYAFGARRPWR